MSKKNYAAGADRHNRPHEHINVPKISRSLWRTAMAVDNADVAKKIAERHAPKPPRKRLGRPACKHDDSVVARCLEMKEQGYKRRFIMTALGITEYEYNAWVSGLRNTMSAAEAKRLKR